MLCLNILWTERRNSGIYNLFELRERLKMCHSIRMAEHGTSDRGCVVVDE